MGLFTLYTVLSIYIAIITAQTSIMSSTCKNHACQSLSVSCNDFTKDFYKELSATTTENIVSSPLSIHMILSLLSHGAGGETLDEMLHGIRYHYKDLIQDAYKSLIAQLNELTAIKLYIANAICVQDGFELLPEFSMVATEAYQSEVLTMDFESKADATNEINQWIKTKTNNKISNLISEDSIDDDMKLIMINAIYFNGNWLHKFDKQNTQNRVFYVAKDQKKFIPTMFNKSKYNYGKIPTLHAKFIEIPYMNTNIVMTIVLPDEVDGLTNLQSNFSWEILKNASRSNNDVELYLPKFKIEFTVDLENTLRALRMNKLFEDDANFNRISKRPLKVSKILHKAIIEVNEAGTEAAAATVINMRVRRMIDMPEEFFVDRPFMFIIEHKQNNIPLFIGSIKDIKATPQKDEL
nr:PREDICTED: antichymotrypsin-2-like isoform X1 [Megachile rotundata]XP_012141559.1 PREDICTED: antichymotrypsin-2-like isoform X1 [Megachile rotundata]